MGKLRSKLQNLIPNEYPARIVAMSFVAIIAFAALFVGVTIFSSMFFADSKPAKIESCKAEGGCWNYDYRSCVFPGLDKKFGCQKIPPSKVVLKHLMIGIGFWAFFIVALFFSIYELGYWAIKKDSALKKKHSWATTTELAAGLMVCIGKHSELARKHELGYKLNLIRVTALLGVFAQWYIALNDRGFEKLGALLTKPFV